MFYSKKLHSIYALTAEIVEDAGENNDEEFNVKL